MATFTLEGITRLHIIVYVNCIHYDNEYIFIDENSITYTLLSAKNLPIVKLSKINDNNSKFNHE